MQWFLCESTEAVGEHCRLSLHVSFGVKFPSEAAGTAFVAGNLVRENNAMTWIGIPLSAQHSYYIRAHWEPYTFLRWWMWHYQLWKGKLKSFWVQKRMEERRPSPDLPSPQGPRGPHGAGMEMQGIPRGRNCPPLPLSDVFASQHLSSRCFISLHPHPFPSSLFMGCHTPSTSRCQSVLAHCYSPPISLAQPRFKRKCFVKVPGSPGGGEGW